MLHLLALNRMYSHLNRPLRFYFSSLSIYVLCLCPLYFWLVQTYQHRAEVPSRNSWVARSAFLPVWRTQGWLGLGPCGWLPAQTQCSREELVTHIACHPLTVVILFVLWAFCHHVLCTYSLFKKKKQKKLSFLFFSGGFDEHGLFQCVQGRRNQPGAGITLFTWMWGRFPGEFCDS